MTKAKMILILIGLTVAVYFIFATIMVAQDGKRWQKFIVENDCHVVEVPDNMFRSMRWECSDGKQYWK